jgi:hypothetical protein
MAIKPTRKIPEMLPCAHLYLEDIEEISQMFQSWAEQEQLLTRRKGSLRYELGDRECDTVQDLAKIGGRHSNFEIIATGPNSRLTITRVFTTYYAPSDRREEAYFRLSQIFEHRKISWRNALRGGPETRWWAFYLYSIPVNLILWLSSTEAVKSSLAPAASFVSWSLLALYICFLCGLFLQHSIIELRYSHEKPGISKRLGDIVPYAVSAAIGALVTKLIDLAVRYFSRQ